MFEEVKELLRKYNQEQLLDFYNELSENDKKSLLAQISNIDFEYMNKLYNHIEKFEMEDKKITSLEAFDKYKNNTSEYEKIGEKMIKEGKLAICSMAGGQGTRLGFDAPKGTFMLDLEKPTSIFETVINKLKFAYEKYGVLVYWYIMTSETNNDATIKFFEDNNFFGYDKEHIIFFKQGELPLLDEKGKVVLKNKNEIFMAPDGNGGIFKALGDNKIIEQMQKNGIQYLAIGNVDNILIHMIDPIIVGLMKEKDVELASKSFMKPTPDGKWGAYCRVNGKPRVIEYIETPRELLEARNEEGELIYGDAHFGCNFFKIDLLERLVNAGLTMHRAIKKNKHITSDGEFEEINTYKFEAFIFDAFEMANDIIVFRTKREEEFAPIKNKEGDESPKTALELYKKFYEIN